jgi:hypothetical protein
MAIQTITKIQRPEGTAGQAAVNKVLANNNATYTLGGTAADPTTDYGHIVTDPTGKTVGDVSPENLAAGLTGSGFLWTKGERNLVFSSTTGAASDWSSCPIRIQASFGQDGTIDGGSYVAHPTDPHDWITLTDSTGSVVEITKQDVVSLTLGQCKIRFVVHEPTNLPADGVNVKIS